MAPSSAPTREIGYPGGISGAFRPERGRRYQYTHEVEPLELNQELAFPRSIPVFDAMRSQDGHSGSVLSAITLPIAKADWQLHGDVRPEVEEVVRKSLGIPRPGEERSRRTSTGVSWKDHIFQAVETTAWAGFMVFEQVYTYHQETGRYYLRKLAPRLPRTITEIETGRDGGLEAVWQTPMYDPKNPNFESKRIPVDQIVFYTHRKEGADWSGRSILRQAHKHWLIKDIMIKLDAQVAERNGMGIPVVTYDQEHLKTEAQNIAESVRAGAVSGIAIPKGCDLKIVGTTGTTVDITPKIRYHDQEIARSALAMFLDMTSNENGSRALAEPIVDVFMDSVQAFADSIAETATEHIVRDIVRLNFGEDEPYPELSPGDLKASGGISAEGLKTLVDAGIIRADDTLEDYVRKREGLPDRDANSARIPSEAAANAETAGTLVRAGYDPSAAAAAGLEHMPHLGLPPVTVQPPRQEPSEVQASQPELEGITKLITQMQEDRTQWYATRTGINT